MWLPFRDDGLTTHALFDDPRMAVLAAVRAGLAIACIPASIATTLPWEDIAVREAGGAPAATVAICHRADAADPLVHAFAATARAVCAD